MFVDRPVTPAVRSAARGPDRPEFSMLIRNCLPSDAEQEAAVYNVAAARLPGFRPVTPDQVRRAATARATDPTTRLGAEVDGRLVGYVAFEPTGRVQYPWCLSGHEGIAHQLFGAALRTLADRNVTHVFAACRADWADQIAFFTDHGFAKARDVVNFTQSITELPTMFQRPGLNITRACPEDVPGIEALVSGFLRLRGPALADYLLKNPAFPAGAVIVLRRKDGSPQGVGIMIDDGSCTSVDGLDPRAPTFWTGAFGTEGLSGKRVNGLFSFLAAPEKEAGLIGQDLLWCFTSRMESNTFEFLAAQVATDVPHLLRFYERYFQKQGGFPVFERELQEISWSRF
jgi:hypothetical protein